MPTFRQGFHAISHQCHRVFVCDLTNAVYAGVGFLTLGKLHYFCFATSAMANHDARVPFSSLSDLTLARPRRWTIEVGGDRLLPPPGWTRVSTPMNRNMVTTTMIQQSQAMYRV